MELDGRIRRLPGRMGACTNDIVKGGKSSTHHKQNPKLAEVLGACHIVNWLASVGEQSARTGGYASLGSQYLLANALARH